MNNVCEKHNQPISHCHKDSQQKVQLFCQICIEQMYKLQNIDEVKNQQKQALKQLELKYDQKIKELIDFSDKLEHYSQNIQQKLKKFKQQLDQYILHFNEKNTQIKNLSISFNIINLNQINEEENIINSLLAQLMNLLKNQLIDVEISTKLDQLYQSLNKFSMEANLKVTEQDNKQQMTAANIQFNNQLIQQQPIKQNQFCCAIAFNQDSTMMIAGCEELIKIFRFKDDKLIQVQQLNGHQQNILCLQFMKKTNQFVSTSGDQSIIIWEQNYNNQWQKKQVLNGHSDFVWCITMNLNENVLISGAYDNFIKIWLKQNNTWSSMQSINCESEVSSISLNDSEDKLIASVSNKKILVFKFKDANLTIIQKIQVEQYGLNLCFINKDQFLFQPSERNHLLVNDYDSKNQSFKQVQILQYSDQISDGHCLFPLRYISKIGLIMVKNGTQIDLIKRIQNGQYSVQQLINFQTKDYYGCVSDDGRYIATWDQQSREIKIRKFDF